jgi:uncharacterized protein YkwD
MIAKFRASFLSRAHPVVVAALPTVVASLILGTVAGAAHAGEASSGGPPSSADLALLAALNAARTDPHGYAKRLREDLAYFHGLIFEPPGGESLETSEGAAAVMDAIADLERRDPAPALTADSEIAKAALHLAVDQGRTGAMGHVDSAHATLRDRLETAGVWAMSMEEDIAYGPTDPAEVIRELIVDDGVPGRDHRKAIFDAAMTRAGYACGPHASWGWVCVIDFTSNAIPQEQAPRTVRADGGGKQTASNP